MKTPIILPLAAALCLTAGCTIPDDLFGGNDNDDASEDTETGDDTFGSNQDGSDTHGDDTHDEGGTGGNDGGTDTGDGNSPGEPQCLDYCERELACDDFYVDENECVAACLDTRFQANSCETQWDDLNTCLADLTCDEFLGYWNGIESLSDGIDPGPFACDFALADFAVCMDDGTEPEPPAPAPGG